MDSHDAQMPASGHQVRKPTEYLTQARIDELSQFSIFLLAKEGFTLQDVRAMVSTSKLYASSKVIERIVGKPRHKKIGKNDDGAFRLNGNRLANSPLSTQTSSDKNGWKTKPCPQVYPLNKPVSDVGHAEPASGSQSTMASLYTSAPHTP
ncbi:TPA: hypothetical protein RG922_003457 [Pseudomonas aeruginosa]